jgi:succinate-acetate transporter protein
MAALEATPDESGQVISPVAEAAAAASPAADPAALGLPCFIMGAVALGLTLVGVVPAAAVGAPLPIILGATSVGLFITTIWAAASGQSALASIFGIFATFWLSYFMLVTGLIRSWFGITVAEITATEELFLITWLVIVVMLILATLRLPVAFTAVFVLVGLTVLLVLLGTEASSTGLVKTGGYALLAAAAGGVYLFFNSLSQATGGSALPLGSPLLHG